MNFEEIKLVIRSYQDLLPVPKAISSLEAEKRSAEFLRALAQVAEWRHTLAKEDIKFTSVKDATWHSVLNEITEGTVDSRKAKAMADDVFIVAREDLEGIENDIEYLKAYTAIFTNAHLFYRQMAKEGVL